MDEFLTMGPTRLVDETVFGRWYVHGLGFEDTSTFSSFSRRWHHHTQAFLRSLDVTRRELKLATPTGIRQIRPITPSCCYCSCVLGLRL